LGKFPFPLEKEGGWEGFLRVWHYSKSPGPSKGGIPNWINYINIVRILHPSHSRVLRNFHTALELFIVGQKPIYKYDSIDL
jgi:hypothetical protein